MVHGGVEVGVVWLRLRRCHDFDDVKLILNTSCVLCFNIIVLYLRQHQLSRFGRLQHWVWNFLLDKTP